LRAEIFAWIFDTHSASATPVPGASQSVVMQGEQRELLVQRPCGSCRARIPFWNMRLECRCAGTRLLGLRSTDRNSERLMHRAMPLPMSLLYATVTNRNLREHSDPGFAGHVGSSNASDAKHSESLDPMNGMPMHPDIPLYPIWHLHRSGDMVTLDGETFLDMRVVPHQAEASTLIKQSGIYYAQHDVMSNSASIPNVVKSSAGLEDVDDRMSTHGLSIDTTSRRQDDRNLPP
jgi:hypothetical protein